MSSDTSAFTTDAVEPLDEASPDESVIVARPIQSRPNARPRVSQRRYALRRIGAAVVAAVFIVAVIKIFGAVFGSSSAAGATDTTLTPVPNDVAVAATTVPSASSTPATAAPSSTAPAAVTPPSAAHPAKLLIVGDSDAGAFAPYLSKLMTQTGVVAPTLDYKVSTGLARPDYFDWPAHLAQTVPAAAPDIVVVTFGGNDAQALTQPDGTVVQGVPTGKAGGDVEWRAEYGKRVGALMDTLSAEGRTLVWVGIPSSQNSADTARMKVQDAVVRAEVAKRPKVLFVDSWKLFSGVEGDFAEFVIDPRDGLGKDVRAKDGFHLNTTGAEILALSIADVIRGDLRARGAAI